MQGKFSREDGFLGGGLYSKENGARKCFGESVLKQHVLLISFYVELSTPGKIPSCK